MLRCIQEEQVTASFVGMVGYASELGGADLAKKCFCLDGVLGEDIDTSSVNEDELGKGTVS